MVVRGDGARALGRLLGIVGGVILATCLLTLLFFPVGSALLWGKVVVGGVLVVAGLGLNHRAAAAALRQRATTYAALTAGLTLGVVVALAALNLLVARRGPAIDLSRERVFTFAEPTQELLRGLDRDLQLLGFYRPGEREGALFDDLGAIAGRLTARLEVRRIDPDRHPDLIERHGITSDGPRTLLVGASSVRLRAPTEEGLAEALLALTQPIARRLYFLIGHGELGIDDTSEVGLSACRADLAAQGYEVMALNLIELGKVPDDASVVVMVAPTLAPTAEEREALQGYLLAGGKALLLLEPAGRPELHDFLRRFHLGYGDDTVLDGSDYRQRFGLGPDAVFVQAAREHPATRGLHNGMAVFVGARSLRLIDAGDGVDEAVTALPLLQSTLHTWAETDLGGGDWTPDPAELRGPLPLAAVATQNTSTVDAARRRGAEMRLVVVGDASFATNRFRDLQLNRDLLSDLVAWLAEQEARIALRPRRRSASRFVATPAQEAALAFVALDGLPVALLALGLGVWLRRQRW